MLEFLFKFQNENMDYIWGPQISLIWGANWRKWQREGNCVGVNKLYLLLYLVRNSSKYSFSDCKLGFPGDIQSMPGESGGEWGANYSFA